MNKLIPGTDNLFINELFEVCDSTGAVCDLPTANDCIEVPFRNGTRSVEKNFLLLLAKFEIPEDIDFDAIRFFDLPIKRKAVKYGAAFIRPQWVFTRFRRVAMFPRIAVSKDGECVNAITGKFIRGYSNKYGYRCVDSYDPLVEKRRSVPVHILVAQAWIYNKIPSVAFIVNHKDGNKQNNTATNLEWCTYLHNNQHAVESGLSSQARACSVRDMETGKILYFPSFQRAALFLGLRGKRNHLNVSSRINRIYCEKYEFRDKLDERPWFYTDDRYFINPGCASRFIYIVTGMKDKPIVINGGTCFKEYFKLWNVNSAMDLLNKFRNLYPNAMVEIVDQGDERDIEVLSEETGKVTTHKTAISVGAVFGISKTTVLDLIRSDGRNSYKGYRMRYKTNAPWNEKQEKENSPIRLRVKIKKTSEIEIYPSVRSVMAAFGMSRAHVLRHITSAALTDDIEITYLD